MSRWFLMFISVLFAFPVFANWKVETRVDAMTDEVTKTAVVENEQGHSFSIYRISHGGPVWGNFALSQKMFDQVDWEKPPIYRIDRHSPTDLASMKRFQELGLMEAYQWEPKWVNFLLWHGKESEGISNSILRLLNGREIVFRYHLSTGGFKDTSFGLQGAALSISEAIGISAQIDHAAQEKSAKFREALVNELKMCGKNKSTRASCSSRISECGKQADQDPERFSLCVQN